MTLLNYIGTWLEEKYSATLLWMSLAASLFFLWAFNASGLPFSNSALILAGDGNGLLDLMPFYTAETAYTAIGSYGAAGRAIYLQFHIADFIFIPAYCMALVFLMTAAVNWVCDKTDGWRCVNVLPLFIGLFDCVENFSVLTMLLWYPEEYLWLGNIAGIATLLKHLFTLGVVALLAYAGFILLTSRLGSNPRCTR